MPRSTIPPDWVQENAWLSKPWRRLLPTTCPLGLTAMAELNEPPRVPRSTIPPAWVQENGWI